MSVTSALLWVGGFALIIVVARMLGLRSRRASYPFAVLVAACIFVAGIVAQLWEQYLGMAAVVALLYAGFVICVWPRLSR